jgi:P4 family phage/plasmid primase-like protien
MGDNINDNDISDCLLLNIMPNIVYNKAEDQMYSYTDSQGWSPYTRENLMYSISFTSRNFDPLIHTYMGSYQIRNLLCSDIIMKIRNVCIVDSLTMKNAIGMKNGIYNVDKHIFEPFNQRYLLNTSTNIFYSDDHSIVLNDILSTIFPSPEIRAFVFRWFGYTIEFGNPEKFLTIWHGPSGNNGKSWLQRLFRETMGDYCCNVPVSLLTSKRQASNAASPDISMLENKLITFLQEPETSERIHGGRAKELTGNDSVYTRNLYKSPRNIDIWAKLVIVSNNHLETIGLDAAMKRRILVIPFESTFVTEIEMEDRINRKASTKHYYIRKNIDKLCSSLAPAFMRLIVDQHRKYTEDGIFLSSLILDYTVEFILSTNRTLKFIRKYLSHLPGTSMSSEILYEQFKVWHKQWYPAKVIPNMEVFIDELIRECYEMKDGSYIEDVYSSYELA